MTHNMNAIVGEPAHVRSLLAHDPHRPAYHYLPPSGQLQDIDGGIHWRGRYHMLYLCHPVFPGGPAHWAHTVSNDMVHWEDLPYALNPQPGTYDEHGIWSGGVIDADGVATILYTGKPHPGTYQSEPAARPEVQCLATSTEDNLINWTKHPANPVIADPPPGLDITAFRDPSLWREDDGWRTLIGSGIRGRGGTALLYRSPDMIHWEYLGQLLTGHRAETGWAWEIPDFFPLRDKWVLTLMPILDDAEDAAIYFIGDYDGRTFTPQRSGLLDAGWLYRAPESFWAPDGRRIVFAWLFEGRNLQARCRAGWSGTASVPRQLSLTPDAHLRITPIHELQTLRHEHCHVNNVTLDPAADPWLCPLAGNQLEIAAQFQRSSATAVQLQILTSPDQRETTIIRYDWTTARLTLDTTRSTSNTEDDPIRAVQVAGAGTQGILAAALTEPPFSLTDDETLSLRVFIDRSIVEVFANDRATMTTRIYPTRTDSTAVSALAESGRAHLVSADVWTMGTIW